MFAEPIGAIKEKVPPKLGSLSMSEYMDKVHNYAHGNRLGTFVPLGLMGGIAVHAQTRQTGNTHKLLGDSGKSKVKVEPERRRDPPHHIYFDEADYDVESVGTPTTETRDVNSRVPEHRIRTKMNEKFNGVKERLPRLAVIVEGIPLEAIECTESEFIEANQSLWTALTKDPTTAVQTSKKKVQSGCGLDLLIDLILKLCETETEQQSDEMDILAMTYKQATERFTIDGPVLVSTLIWNGLFHGTPEKNVAAVAVRRRIQTAR